MNLVFDILSAILAPSKFDPSRQYVNLFVAFRDPAKGRVTASIQTSDPEVVGLAPYKGYRFSVPMRAVHIADATHPDGTPVLREKTGERAVNIDIVEETTITCLGVATPPAAKVVGLPPLPAAAPAAAPAAPTAPTAPTVA